MATLKKGSMGFLLKEIRGSIGDVIIRQMNGKTIIYSKPKKFRKSQSPASIAGRNKWKTVSRFAKFIRDIPALEAIWKQTGSASINTQSKLLKYNYSLADTEWPTVRNVITRPPFDFIIRDLILFEDNVSVIMADGFEPDPNDKLFLIMALLEPKNPEGNKFHLMNISPAGANDFNIILNNYQLEKFFKYKRYIIYSVIIRQKENEIYWSNTLAIEGELENHTQGIK